MKKLVLLILITVLLFAVSCTGKDILEDEIAYIEIRTGSLKASYLLDEKLNLAEVYIVVKLKGNKGERVVNVTKDMIVGFDTSTTAAAREMYITYKGKTTTPWIYSVVNKYEITTAARLTLSNVANEGGTRLIIGFDKGDIERIYAVKFEVQFEPSVFRLRDHPFSGSMSSGWANELDKHSGSVTVLYYAETGGSPIESSGRLLSLDFTGAETGKTFKLSAIVIADRENEYSLPDVTLKT